MRNITTQEMERVFAGIAGCSFVSLNTITVPTLTGGKQNPHQGRVRKHCYMVVFCGGSPDYGSMVENKAVKAALKEAGLDENIEVSCHPVNVEGLWKGHGEHLQGAVVRHTGTDARYISVYVPANARPQVHYTLDGLPIEKDQIIGLKASGPSEREVELSVTREDGTVDVETRTVEMIPRIFKLASVRSFRVNGEVYVHNVTGNGTDPSGGQTVELASETERILVETEAVLRRLIAEIKSDKKN